MEPRLKERYKNIVTDRMMEKFNYKNKMQVPRLEKIVINMGIGKDNKDTKAIESAEKELSLITGQKPVITKAKTSIAAFNLRKGDICGLMVTLRGKRMWEFLDRMIVAALPRVRDFNGLNPNSGDGKGGYTIGIKENVIFPEIDYNTIYKMRGMNITIVTTAKTSNETVELLREIGLPVRRK